VEITSHIFAVKDPKTQRYLIDLIKPVAEQMGTGMWTSESALDLQVPTTIINTAVDMRDMSLFTEERKQSEKLYSVMSDKISLDKKEYLKLLYNAMYVAIMLSYAQGLMLLGVASKKYKYELDLKNIAQIWRGGCIIRSAMLNDITAAFANNGKLSNLLLDPAIAKEIQNRIGDLRKLVAVNSQTGIPTPALMDALSYFNAFCEQHTPANLIQAQRDYFGSHGYERVDISGKFHTQWEKETVK
jgi:6-phosphogluconate dehydrogenase